MDKYSKKVIEAQKAFDKAKKDLEIAKKEQKYRKSRNQYHKPNPICYCKNCQFYYAS